MCRANAGPETNPHCVEARAGNGDHLHLFMGIIDILQQYQFAKKIEHTWKAIFHDGVCLYYFTTLTACFTLSCRSRFSCTLSIPLSTFQPFSFYRRKYLLRTLRFIRVDLSSSVNLQSSK